MPQLNTYAAADTPTRKGVITNLRKLTGRGVSVKEYGAVGDGVTDDSAAILAAMTACFADRTKAFVNFPPGEYKVASSINFSYAGNVTWRHGLLFDGATLVSTISGATSDVLNIICTSSRITRFLRIEGLCIDGSGTERDGLRIIAATTNDIIYNFDIVNPIVEGVGKDGIHIEGNIFEGAIFNPYCQDNGQDGLAWGHHASGGIASATTIFSGSFAQNGRYGLNVLNNAYDIRCHGCYFRHNQQFGLVALNGFTLVSGCGFENNWQSHAGVFSAGYGGIGFQNFGTVAGCSGNSNDGNQSCLINGAVVSRLNLVGGNMLQVSGASAAATLVNLSGSGNVYLGEDPWAISVGPVTGPVLLRGDRGKAFYTNVAASAAVTATATQTAFDKKATIVANTLQPGDCLKIRFQGIATATNASDTLRIRLYYGGTAGTLLLDIPATDATNNDIFTGEYELIIRTIGASGTMVGVGTFKSIPAAEGTMTIKDDILASTTVDTTADKDIVVSATWSSSNAGNSCRLDFLKVEKV